jgi:competence protein ComEC
MLLPPGWLLWTLAGAGLVGAAIAGPVRQLRLAALLLLAIALGGLRYQPVTHLRDDVTIWRLADRGEILVQGIVSADPKWTEEGQQIILKTEAARREDIAAPIDGLLLVNLPPYPTYHYGQRLIVRGIIREPPPARRPNAFNYRSYLARKRIFAMMQEPAAVTAQPGNAGNPALVALLAFRTHCHSLMLRALPEPEASVAGGMLLGLKATIPDRIYTTFSANGITHVLVISGWHLSLVASVITGVATRLRFSRGQTFWFSLVAIWIYALFVGATGTVLRAALMASLTVLATATERKTEPWTLLMAAALGLTLWNPHILWDLGFQLSMLATASIFAFLTPIQAWLEDWPPLRWWASGWITDPLSVTLAAQTLALPLILYHFGNLSLVSPLSNVLLVPAVPYVMMLCAIALAINVPAALLGSIAGIGIVAGWVAQGLWLVAWLPITYMTSGAALLASVPGASLPLPPFPLWLLLGYYGAVAGWWLWQQWARYQETIPAPVVI